MLSGKELSDQFGMGFELFKIWIVLIRFSSALHTPTNTRVAIKKLNQSFMVMLLLLNMP